MFKLTYFNYKYSIWTYLKNLANCGKTIIITTHYIEEARLSNTVKHLLFCQ